MKYISLLLIFLFSGYSSYAQVNKSFFFEGDVTDRNGKGIRDAKINIYSINKTFMTDKQGRFSFNLPEGDYLFQISAADFKSKEAFISLSRDTIINYVLQSLSGGILLEEVQVKGRASDKVTSPLSGIEILESSTVNKMPSLLGERDPIRALQLLPGVTATTEGSAEMNVRGGGNDQNLISLDRIPLYSATHLFGLYSSFNPLAISRTTIYKGYFPADYGGKLSSVTELNTIDTLSKQFSAIADIGISSAKAMISIPMLKQRSSLYLSGRRSYYDVLFKTFGKGNAEIFNFGDYNLGWIYQPDPKNRIKLTLYHENDAIGTVNNEVGQSKGTANKDQSAAGLNWKHDFNSSLNNDLTVYYSAFNNMLSEEKRTTTQSYLYDFRSSVADVGFINTLTYSASNNLSFYGGINTVYHTFKPSLLSGDENNEPFHVRTLAKMQTTDMSFFAGGVFSTSWGGTLSAGLRNNNYLTSGNNYHTVEPRISYLQPLGENSSLKLSYSEMVQPVHLLNNPGLGLPQDIILSAGLGIDPQSARHFSAEYAKNFKFEDNEYSFSIQPFYKQLKNIISFRDGFDTRSLMINPIYRADGYNQLITTGNRSAYGTELLLEKKTGRLNGWVSYTLLKTSDIFSDLNNGMSFSSPQDRRHNLNTVLNYQINRKWNIGLTWMFISGQPVNVPGSIFPIISPNYQQGNLAINGEQYLYEQGGRGSFRMKPFHKLDITFEYKFKLAGMNAVWNFGAYNFYNRKNPSFYYLGKADNPNGGKRQPVLKSVSLFPTIPSSSLRIKF